MAMTDIERTVALTIRDGLTQATSSARARMDHVPGTVSMMDCLQIAREVLKMIDKPMRRVRDLKRGSTYHVLGKAEAQVSNGTLAAHSRLLSEGQTLTVYRAEEDGKLWVRFPEEFEDGRYEDVP